MKVKCTRCPKVYDTGYVEVTARYADCSMWKCPGCGRQCDDREWTGVCGWTRIRREPVFDIYGTPTSTE